MKEEFVICWMGDEWPEFNMGGNLWIGEKNEEIKVFGSIGDAMEDFAELANDGFTPLMIVKTSQIDGILKNAERLEEWWINKMSKDKKVE